MPLQATLHANTSSQINEHGECECCCLLSLVANGQQCLRLRLPAVWGVSIIDRSQKVCRVCARRGKNKNLKMCTSMHHNGCVRISFSFDCTKVSRHTRAVVQACSFFFCLCIRVTVALRWPRMAGNTAYVPQCSKPVAKVRWQQDATIILPALYWAGRLSTSCICFLYPLPYMCTSHLWGFFPPHSQHGSNNL